MSDVWRTEGTKGEETWIYFTKGNVWYTVVVSIQAASLLKPLTPVCLDLPPKALGLFGNQCLILKDPNPKWFNNICFALNQKLILSLFINQSCFKGGGGEESINLIQTNQKIYPRRPLVVSFYQQCFRLLRFIIKIFDY